MKNMKNLLVLMLAIAVVLTVVNGIAAAKELKVPKDYATIQLAIGAAQPGDKVKVEKGTYLGQVLINKSITVEGSGADKTIIDGQNKTNLTSVGQVRITAAGDVEFSGFTIVNAGRPGAYPATRVAIYAQSASSTATYNIHHAVLIGSNDPNDDQDYGFYSNSGKETLTFTHNEISKTGANAILLELHSGPTDFSHNTFDAGAYGADAYFNMNYGGTDITSPQKVSHNKIDMGTGGPFDSAHRATGVSFVAGFTGTPGGFTDVQIDHNDFDNLQPYRRGAGLWNNLPYPAYRNNIPAVIEHNKVSGDGGQFGIDTVGYFASVQINHNEINGVDTGISLRTWNNQSAAGMTISDNHIKAALGLGLEAGSASNQINQNHVDATGPFAVVLNNGTFYNIVTDNHLKALSAKGDTSVKNLGVNNVVKDNK
ncbi:MAG: hypothetical protein PHX83_06025 [Acidobacteriia bacterium]|nr:hypothetical protein [Terriglobia bacterium]